MAEAMVPDSARARAEPWRDAAAQPLIVFDAVEKRFGAVRAVAGVRLSIFEGEFFCLLGPSGCGKTTLMRMLAGFEAPDSGRILLAGRDLAGVPPHRRPVNMMFQSYALFPHMSVEANIGFGLRREGKGREEVGERVAAIVRAVQLQGLETRRPDQLSGGQKQRVALARALVKRPKVLLLDEPLGALDKKLREETQYELMSVQRSFGVTFVMVTHDQDEAMTMATRIGVMDKGGLVQVGPPGDIYEAPATRAVAEFVGGVAIFEGAVAGSADGVVALATDTGGDGGLRPLLVAHATAVPVGAPAAIAVRPEKIRLWPGHGEALCANVLAGEVWDVGYLGETTQFRVRLSTGRVVRVVRLNASRAAESPVSVGDPVRIGFDPADAILLPG